MVVSSLISTLGNSPKLLLISLALIIYLLTKTIYNVYLHPLRGFPGPKRAAVSNLCYVYWLRSGKFHTKVKELHNEYGDVVRVTPNMLIYRSVKAWEDIYGRPNPGTGPFPKDENHYNHNPKYTSVVTAGDEMHAKQRKVLIRAFSGTALKEREPTLQYHVDKLVRELRDRAETGSPADMVKWYNYAALDIITSLMFGESFDCLGGSWLQSWPEEMFRMANVGVVTRLAFYLLLGYLGKAWVSRAAKTSRWKGRWKSLEIGKDKLNRRLKQDRDQLDVVAYFLKHNEKSRDRSDQVLTMGEMHANISVLLIAGSESSSTTMAACTAFLLTHPDVYKRLVDEIRTAFPCERDITQSSVAGLTYLPCVIDEALRLHPPVPTVLARTVPQNGAFIDGRFVPGGTCVSIFMSSAYRNAKYFSQPDTFIPERWLPDRDPEFETDQRNIFHPFSYGPRDCLGKQFANVEIRLILARVLWNFDIASESSNVHRWHDQRAYIIWEKNPLLVKFTPVDRGV